MKEPVKELSIERIKELLGNKKLSDETITKVMERIKRFCKIAYELYLKKNKPTKPTDIINIDSEIEKSTEEKTEQNQQFKRVE